MAMYNLPEEEHWPRQLGRVIQSYMQGQERKKQMQMQQAQMQMASQKAQQEQQMNAAKLQQIEAYANLLKRFGGGQPGAPGGVPQGQGDTLPGLELDRIGQSGASFSVKKPETAEDIKAQIAKDAAVLKNLPEDSPMRKLVIESMLRNRKKLAEIMGMEIRETPEQPRDTPWYMGGGITDAIRGDLPAKTEVVPRGTPPGPQPRTKPLGLEPGQPGTFSRQGMGEVLTGLKSLMTGEYKGLPAPKKEPSKEVPKRTRTGIGGIGSEFKKAYFPQGTLIDKPTPTKKHKMPQMPGRFDPKRKPTGKAAGKATMKAPPKPKDPKEKAEHDKIMAVWFNLPSSVQWSVWNGYTKGLTWEQIASSDDLKRYIK